MYALNLRLYATGATLQARLLALLFCLITMAAVAQPTDNAFRTFYPGTASDHWTENLPWARVIDITTVQGANWLDKMQKAQDQLVAQGGGVIFFPAGDYYIQNNFALKPNIILRGMPSVDPIAKSNGFSPRSRLSFPEYVPTFSGNGTPDTTAFKSITAPNSFNNAVVDLDINRAKVLISQGGGQSNRNGLVLSVRSNNCATSAPDVPSATQLPWQRFSYRFGYNIVVRNVANAIVANCRVNDMMDNITYPIADDSFDQPGYLADSSGVMVPAPPGHAVFSYTDHYGINVNRSGANVYATPQTNPELFRPGCEVLDNWVLKTMRVGIMAAGMGLKVKRNHVTDKPGKTVWLRPEGRARQANNSATYENRGIDFSGWSVDCDSNLIEVYRHRFLRNNYLTIDGEGILVQECCGGTSVNDYKIRGNSLNAYIGIYKMRDIHNLVIENNDLQGKANILVLANTNGCSGNNIGPCYSLRNVWVRNNYGLTGGCSANPGAAIVFDGDVEGQNVFCYNNTADAAPNANCSRTIDSFRIAGPCYISLNPDANLPNNNTNVRLFRSTCSTPIISRPSVFPAISILRPTDTTIINASGGPVTYTIQTLPDFDPSHNVKVEYWVDARLVATLDNLVTPNIDSFDWIVTPADQGNRVITARIYDMSLTRSNYAFSQPVVVKVLAPLSSPASLQATSLAMYPNPVMAGEQVRISAGMGQVAKAELISTAGQVLQQTSLVADAGEYHLNTTGLKPGMYIIRLTEGGKGRYGRVVVR